MDGEIKFNCSGCGACCRRVNILPNFPEPINEDGSCSHLQEDNSCAIYEDRPEICHVEKMYDKRHFTMKELTRKEYYKENNRLCNEWIERDELDKKFLIDSKCYD